MAFRLKSLYIKEYKNIREQTFDFSSNTGYIALIGLNGSGKSNLLEAISLIFDTIYGIPCSETVGGFKITYTIDGTLYESANLDENNEPVDLIKPERLPSSIIACYSGEDLRLWHRAYEEYYMGYFNDAVKKIYSIPRLLYVNRYCWKIAFIALVCSNNQEIKDFLSSSLHISHPSEVELEFNFQDAKKEIFTTHTALKWFNRITSEGAQVNLNSVATTDVEVEARVVDEAEKAQYIFNFLYLLTQPQKNEKNRIDKLIENIKITVNNGKSINFDDLSEGEKKLILIECITKVLGDENALILLDEPDAHTHVAMKKDLLKAISDFSGQTIMTTHSPMFLNKRWDWYEEKNIYYMHDGQTEKTDPLQHLAELTDNEVDYFEGAFILSSKKILVVEGKYDDKYLLKAIDIFAKRDAKYEKLKDVTIFSANGASAAEVIYNQVFANCIDRIDKLVFLFDYDDGGWKDGWSKIDAIPNKGTKILPMFYQDSYPSANYPTLGADVERANGGSKTIKLDKSFMVEDLFPQATYLTVIQPVISARSHKDFRCINIGKGGTKEAIKQYIENNYDQFSEADYDGFKNVLDELLRVF